MGMRARVRGAPVWALLFWASVAWDGRAWGLTLRSTKAEAFLGEVRPGGTASFAGAVGAPLGVENAGGEPARLQFSLALPPSADVPDGYEALPDARWARLTTGATAQALSPGRSRKANIAVRVPKDARLEGGQYAFDCVIKGRNAAGSAVTLKTRVLFAVGSGDPPRAGPRTPQGFDVSPRAGRMEKVPLGAKTALRDDAFRGLKLINAGRKALTVRLATVRAWPDDVSPPEGFAPAPNPRWLKTGPPVRVPAGAVREAALDVFIPAQPRYAGRKWSFLLALDVDDGARRGRRWFVMSVETKEPQER